MLFLGGCRRFGRLYDCDHDSLCVLLLTLDSLLSVLGNRNIVYHMSELKRES